MSDDPEAGAAPAAVVLNGADLTIEDIVRVARDPRVRVTCAPEALERVAAGWAEITGIVEDYRAALAAGRPLPRVYGVTTGFGEFKATRIEPDHFEQMQRNILLSHSVGVGDNADPNDPANYSPAEVVRAALVLRLNAFLKGHSGVRPELVECVAAMVNRGIVPLVPTRGSLGASGDLCPLAHLFVVLLGEGRYYVVRTSQDLQYHTYAGRELRAARDSLAADLGQAIPQPSFKEGLALTNGATFSAALLALAVYDAERLANTADVSAALTLEALCGRSRALDPKVHAARNMDGQRDSAANLRALITGSRLIDVADDVQDAYSVRCTPQVHGAVRDAVAYARMVAERECNAATDNPLFFPEPSAVSRQPSGSSHQPSAGGGQPTAISRQPSAISSQPLAGGGAAAEPWDVRTFYANRPASFADRHAYSAGNFHGEPVALAADFLAIAVAELANIAERRTQMLLDARHNRNLPANLIAKAGLNSGYMIAQYTAASLVSENKVLAHPASVDSIPSSSNTEDHVSMSSIAARKLRTVLGNVQATLAIELLVAAQAIDWRVGMRRDPNPPEHQPADAPTGGTCSQPGFLAGSLSLSDAEQAEFARVTRPENRAQIAERLAPGTRAAYLAVRAVAPAMVADRVLEPDIRAVRRIIENETLVAGANAGLCAAGEAKLLAIPALGVSSAQR